MFPLNVFVGKKKGKGYSASICRFGMKYVLSKLVLPSAVDALNPFNHCCKTTQDVGVVRSETVSIKRFLLI